MEMPHVQFTRDTRVELAAYLAAGKKKNECAKLLGMARSSIGREINNNEDPDGIYRGSHAHKRAMQRRKEGKSDSNKIENNAELKKYIVRKLKKTLVSGTNRRKIKKRKQNHCRLPRNHIPIRLWKTARSHKVPASAEEQIQKEKRLHSQNKAE